MKMMIPTVTSGESLIPRLGRVHPINKVRVIEELKRRNWPLTSWLKAKLRADLLAFNFSVRIITTSGSQSSHGFPSLVWLLRGRLQNNNALLLQLLVTFSASLRDLNRAQMNNEGFGRFLISGAAKKVLLLPLHSQLPPMMAGEGTDADGSSWTPLHMIWVWVVSACSTDRQPEMREQLAEGNWPQVRRLRPHLTGKLKKSDIKAYLGLWVWAGYR